MSFDPAQVVSLLVGAVLPLLVGLVAKTTWTGGVKAVVLLVLSGVTSVLSDLGQTLVAHTAFDLPSVLLTALFTFLTGVGVHFGLLKPTNAAARLKGLFTKPVPPAGS